MGFPNLRNFLVSNFSVENFFSYIPQQDRVFFEISHNEISKNVFVDKNYSIGKTISSARESSGFSFSNLETETGLLLDRNKDLSELLNLGLILNGDKLISVD